MKLQQYCIRKYRPLEIQHFLNIIYLWNCLRKNRKSLSDSALLKTIFSFRKKLFSQNIELLQYCIHGTIYINFVELESPMIHAKFQDIWFWRRRFFKVFTIIILAWRPSWSCDLDHLYKLSFPLPKEAPHKIWL